MSSFSASDGDSRVRLVGHGEWFLLDPFGEVKAQGLFDNLVTTAGDQYYAQRAIGSGTAATGMKLGTGTAAATKSGAAAALGTYIAGSNRTFDATYPQAVAKGTDIGWRASYQATWAAGVATNAAISEVVLVNDAGTDATSTAANTYSRAVFSPVVNKGANDQFIVLWHHELLGA